MSLICLLEYFADVKRETLILRKWFILNLAKKLEYPTFLQHNVENIKPNRQLGCYNLSRKISYVTISHPRPKITRTWATEVLGLERKKMEYQKVV